MEEGDGLALIVAETRERPPPSKEIDVSELPPQREVNHRIDTIPSFFRWN